MFKVVFLLTGENMSDLYGSEQAEKLIKIHGGDVVFSLPSRKSYYKLLNLENLGPGLLLGNRLSAIRYPGVSPTTEYRENGRYFSINPDANDHCLVPSIIDRTEEYDWRLSGRYDSAEDLKKLVQIIFLFG